MLLKLAVRTQDILTCFADLCCIQNETLLNPLLTFVKHCAAEFVCVVPAGTLLGFSTAVCEGISRQASKH
jgi:hypothetical protein